MCNKKQTNDKIQNWKTKIDDYYKNTTPEQFKKDLIQAGFIKNKKNDVK